MRIEPTCQALHVSRTTRYCRLKEEGTSFSSLVAEVRQELSAELICQGAGGDGQRAAGGQGHEHVPPFLRAFKRWFDRLPGAFREERWACRLRGRWRAKQGDSACWIRPPVTSQKSTAPKRSFLLSPSPSRPVAPSQLVIRRRNASSGRGSACRVVLYVSTLGLR